MKHDVYRRSTSAECLTTIWRGISRCLREANYGQSSFLAMMAMRSLRKVLKWEGVVIGEWRSGDYPAEHTALQRTLLTELEKHLLRNLLPCTRGAKCVLCGDRSSRIIEEVRRVLGGGRYRLKALRPVESPVCIESIVCEVMRRIAVEKEASVAGVGEETSWEILDKMRQEREDRETLQISQTNPPLHRLLTWIRVRTPLCMGYEESKRLAEDLLNTGAFTTIKRRIQRDGEYRGDARVRRQDLDRRDEGVQELTGGSQ